MDAFVIEHGSDWYWKALDLRRRILRWPLGREYSDEDIAAEADQTPIVIAEGETVLSTLVLQRYDERTIKVRQVAVDEHLQGKGIGRQMSEFAEQWAVANGYTQAVLNARDVAIPFYLKLGYRTTGDPFTEVGIPHMRMEKQLV